MKYIVGIDQSTQGTKALLSNEQARLLGRANKNHRQITSHGGCISHHPEELYKNTLEMVRRLVEGQRIPVGGIYDIGISNQWETTMIWEKEMRRPVYDAIVWQRAGAERICQGFTGEQKEYIAANTGIPLSPYFLAVRMSWVLKHCKEAGKLTKEERLLAGTVDSWLLYKLTGGEKHKTDHSNASRTQLFSLHTLSWDEQVCAMFGIPVGCLPEMRDSNPLFGMADSEGLADRKVPIHAVMGDSHEALYGQGYHQSGMVKATYGTGSSLMMNMDRESISSSHGIMTSLAWGIDGQVDYVLEGNLNYTGAVISWLKGDLRLIESVDEAENLVRNASQEDTTYLVPAFSGLGAPYRKSDGKAIIYGMNRGTGEKEVVRAALNCIAYQITDILKAMGLGNRMTIEKLCVDGGPTRNGYLMQFQSNMDRMTMAVPNAKELSDMGAAYLAGITIGMFTREQSFSRLQYREYRTSMDEKRKHALYEGWLNAARRVLGP